MSPSHQQLPTGRSRQDQKVGPGKLSAATVLGILLLGIVALISGPGIPSDSSAAPPVSSAPYVPDEVLVKFRPGVSPGVLTDIARKHHVSRTEPIPAIGVTKMKLSASSGGVEAVVQALSHNLNVEFAEPNYIASTTETVPNDPYYMYEWGVTKTRTNIAWDITRGSSSVVIAMLDTGVDFTQPDLQEKFVAGYDFVNNDSDPTDDHGHGTLVTGVASANANNNIGVASYCWNCSLMPVKTGGSDGYVSYSVAASGITWATDHGARVINMSWGGTASSGTLLSAVKYAHDRGVVLVAAAGNYGTSTPVYPAAYPEVISAAGSDPSDALYSWSSYGSWVKVAAPGCNMTTGRDGWYGGFCGTSSASPVVAGIAGLLLSAAPDSTNSAIESAIERSASPMGSVVAYGRVDAAAALAMLVGAGNPTATPTPTPSPPPTSAPDTIPPQVTLTSPTAGQTVRGTVSLNATASDNSGVDRVAFYVDGVLYKTDASAPYSVSWNTRKTGKGMHTITAVASDTSGNTASDEISVIVTR